MSPRTCTDARTSASPRPCTNPRARALGAILVAALLTGCGLNVQGADLFLLTRTGQARRLTLVVNDSGTIRCDGAAAKSLPDSLLIQARALASDLDKDARAKLRVPVGANSVFSYTIKLENGSITFPDTAARQRHELAEAELFAAQAAQGPCGLRG